MAVFKFILLSEPGAKSNPRQIELQRSEALSHAAIISYARRYGRRGHGKNVAFIANDCVSYQNQPPKVQSGKRAITCHPRNLLGQSKLDPFHSGQFEELPLIMQGGMEYVYEVLWPINTPALEGHSLRTVINTWRHYAVASPLIFHAQVVNAAALCYALASNPVVKKDLEVVRLIHQTKAIHLVQEAINCLSAENPPMALIACIMNLSASTGQILNFVPADLIPESPIFQAFNIKHYGRFTQARAHFDALIGLVYRIGGIEELPPEVANPLQQ